MIVNPAKHLREWITGGTLYQDTGRMCRPHGVHLGQSTRACIIDSTPPLHWSQPAEGTQYRWNKTLFVARDPWHARQTKCRSLGGPGILQIVDQHFLTVAASVLLSSWLWPRSPSQYPLFTEYIPFLFIHQNNLSPGQVVDKGMLKIALTVSSSKRVDSRSSFQVSNSRSQNQWA